MRIPTPKILGVFLPLKIPDYHATALVPPPDVCKHQRQRANWTLQMYPVAFHSACIIHSHPCFVYSLYHIYCPFCEMFFYHSHPVQSEPQGPSLWLSDRHHRRLWRARTASSSQRCTGERRFSATTPPSWQAVWAGAAATPAQDQDREGKDRAGEVEFIAWYEPRRSTVIDCGEWARCWRKGMTFLLL